MQSAAINGHRIAISAVAFGASRPFLVVVGRAVLVAGKGELVPDVDGRLAGRLVDRLDAPHRANTPFVRTCAARSHKVPVDGVVSGAHTRLGRRRQRRRPRWWRRWRRWRRWRQWRSEAREAPEGMLTTQQAHLHIRMMPRHQPSSVGHPNASISLSSNYQWAISKRQVKCKRTSTSERLDRGRGSPAATAAATARHLGCKGHQRSSVIIKGHQRSSTARHLGCKGHQRSSVAIKGHQWSSTARHLGCKCHQRSSVIIKGHQRSSKVINGSPPGM